MTINENLRILKAVEDAIWQVEQLLGPLNKGTFFVKGDDDRSILKHNLRCIMTGLVKDLRNV